ncbi:MAG: hypothetical protein K6C33_09015 [Desulfovibrio sp.]|jgi:hypothetical protein|nr:hypothetical protein [Desulfovibrio sp.]MCR5170580.1 hypothetical protein [Desulfovibrio sp.]
MEILLICADPARLAPAMRPFVRRGITVLEAPTLAGGLAALKAALPHPPALVLLDEGEGRSDDGAMRRAVMQIIAASAFTYVSAVSSRSAEELHDAMEGLGMLAPLPAEPGEADGEALLQQLARFVAV